MTSKENYGWYSKKQHTSLSDDVEYGLMRPVINSRGTRYCEKQCHNSYIYQTENGDEVLCTEVTSTPDYPTSKFDDFVSLGKVVKFIKSCYTEVQ